MGKERDWFENLGTADEPVPPHLKNYTPRHKYKFDAYLIIGSDGRIYNRKWKVYGTHELHPHLFYFDVKGAKCAITLLRKRHHFKKGLTFKIIGVTMASIASGVEYDESK